MTEVESYADPRSPVGEGPARRHDVERCGCLVCADERKAYGLSPVTPYVSLQIKAAQENRLARRSA